jgi:hypothetical protein
MSIVLDGVDLPKDLEWQDEFDWTPVSQNKEVFLSGTLVVEEAAQNKGRPITLYGGANASWVTRSTVLALYALAQSPANVMTLNYHGTEYSVMWSRSEIPIEAKPVQRIMNPGPDHKYYITLRLFEVES